MTVNRDIKDTYLRIIKKIAEIDETMEIKCVEWDQAFAK
jgi:hypothetical protein